MKTIINKKKLIVINLFLVIVLMITSVAAWFVSAYSNSVYSNEVKVRADGALELSVTGNDTDFHSSINLSDYNWFQHAKFSDVTGSGDGNFVRPALTQYPDYAAVNTSGTWSTPSVSTDTTEGDYVKFKLYMRSEDPMDVYLGEDSSVEPSVGIENLINTTTQTFSGDLIVGALRLSACTSGTNTRMFTWIPKPEIFVSDDASQRSITFSDISVNKTSGASYTHSYYDSSKRKQSATLNVLTGDITSSSRIKLATLSKASESDKYYTGQVDMYVWLEGCDNEARRAFVNGKFLVNLNLEAQDPNA